jgi:S-adenosylmethionine synthetase
MARRRRLNITITDRPGWELTFPAFNHEEHPMNVSPYTFTSESVSEGHPDKLADQISDSILDEFLRYDPYAKVACEALVTSDLVVVAGEFGIREDLFTEIKDRAPGIVRTVLRSAGYTADFPGIDPDTVEIRLVWHPQSPDIRQGVDREHGVIGAGDQGMVFGFACDETEELMPLPITLAHKLAARQAELRRNGALPWLRPDAKSQVSVRYAHGRLIGVDTVVLSTQHDEGIDAATISRRVVDEIILPVIPAELLTSDTQYLINPTGTFTVGGPAGDTGLTGRKIIVDTYGGACPHGGGAFSGKDPTKIDRSAAYAARFVARNIVASGIARRCTIQVAYAIGVPEPVSIRFDFHGTGTVPESVGEDRVREQYDLTPAGIIERLELRRPIYKQTSVYGHFGRDPETFPWERSAH